MTNVNKLPRVVASHKDDVAFFNHNAFEMFNCEREASKQRIGDAQNRINKLFSDQLELRRKAEVVLATAKQNNGVPTMASLKDLEDLL